ncbi:hypothetical protein [Flammeovirga kamogawensis]|uniref:Phage shock protein B n=1 Tax=Flammeovirga kamogawensis TaxID=373891 RepID=A0ABX8H0I5_9BACT|nr:hypothetical protein [Flammeovirga kamogawensis]MBB6459556.1 hypothetical protein [Flammeovirga kamogawensis]QWG09107.1 hypothetical protein KM029_09215 [Flammeovirga kamogawensis]TRX67395.1 hypothetical protein EO216_04255 [Flammeovirga kamogawensis]
MESWVLIPLMALSIPIIAILTSARNKNGKSNTKKIENDLKQLQIENLELKQRLENIETIVAEPDWQIDKTLNSGINNENNRLK